MTETVTSWQPKDLLFYAVTSRDWLAGRRLVDAVEQVLAGGASIIQLREKELSFEQFTREAQELLPLCEQYQVPLIINDDVQVAAAIGAGGVHVGQSDLSVAKARAVLGEQAIIGVSVQTVAQALVAQEAGANYLGVGAVFQTTTKLDARLVSLGELKAISAAVSIPVVAIGGIDQGNLAELAGSGIAGVALVSAIFAAEDIKLRCRELRQAALAVVHPVRGVIFDLDGTLLDSMAVWENVGSDYINKLGFIPEERLAERFLKLSLEEAADYFIQRYGLELTQAEIATGINQQIENAYISQIAIKGAARAVLQDLQSRAIPMCICTATDRHLVEAALGRLRLKEYFKGIITIGESGYTKRQPEIFEAARTLLGTPREHTWVVEDALHALQTANAAGFPTVAIYEQAFASDQQALLKQADVYLQQIGDWDWR